MGNVVVVNGFSRTGSTKCFCTAQCILAELDIPFKSDGANLFDVDRAIERHLAVAQRDWLTIKTHRWLPAKRNDSVKVFYTTRNLADVARSFIAVAARRKTFDGPREGPQGFDLIATQEITWQAFFNTYCASLFPMVQVSYEEFYRDDSAYVRMLAAHMGLTLSDAGVARVAARISVERIKAETDALAADIDPVTQYRKFHISETLGAPNGSMDDLPPAIRSLLGSLK